jgi:hypothetical protein
MHHSIYGLIFSPSSPETVGWSWPEVGEDGEDAWFGVSPEMGMVEWVWGISMKKIVVSVQ